MALEILLSKNNIVDDGSFIFIDLSSPVNKEMDKWHDKIVIAIMPRKLRFTHSNCCMKRFGFDSIIYDNTPVDKCISIIKKALAKGKSKQVPDSMKFTSTQAFNIVCYLYSGFSQAECAEYFNITVKTVSTHKRNVMTRMCISTDYALLRLLPFITRTMRTDFLLKNSKWKY